MANCEVLTVYAFQVTMRKEDSSAPFTATEIGLFSKMKLVKIEFDLSSSVTVTSSLISVDPA
jgi:hypothetical protein